MGAAGGKGNFGNEMIENTGRGCKRDERRSRGLTFFCVARCVLARVAHQAVEVPGSRFQHVKPE